MSDTLEMLKTFIADKQVADMYVAGAAGTGKTTCLKEMAEYCSNNKISYKICAYTHRAAAVIASIVPKDAEIYTLHSLLTKRPTVNVNATKLKYVDSNTKAGTPEAPAIIFVDEFSMVGEKDYVDILAMLEDDEGNVVCKVVFLGDPYQLPPVGDVLTIRPKLPYYQKLTKVYRQAGDNKLLDTLSAIVSFIDGKSVTMLEPHETFVRGCDLVETYKKYGGEAVLLAYTNARVQELNAAIQGRTAPAIGDIVYSPTTRCEGIFENGVSASEVRSITKLNNDILTRGSDKYNSLRTLKQLEGVQFGYLEEDGICVNRAYVFGHRRFLDIKAKLKRKAVAVNAKIEKIAEGNVRTFKMFNKNHPLVVESTKAWREYLTFDECVICLDFNHAMTVHKAQGSTYETVLIDMPDLGICADWDWEYYLKLVYVAISRASKKVYTN